MTTLVSFLKRVAIFRDLDEADLEALSTRFEARKFQRDETVIQEGDFSDEFFIIQSGEAKVTRGPIGEEVIITSLGPAEYFGEAALFNNVKRSANIQALEPIEALTIQRAVFEEFLEARPLAGNKILQHMLRQLFFRLEKTNAQLEFERQGGFAQNAIRGLLS